MDLNAFNPRERQALLDIFVLGMYADGHLASAEDAQARRLLAAMGHETLDDRNRELDAAITRVSRHAPGPSVARPYLISLAAVFRNARQRADVYSLLAELMHSDNELAAAEDRFLTTVREVFAP